MHTWIASSFNEMSEPVEASSQKCPFRKADELNSDLDTSRDCLPGYPRIKLSDDKNLLEFVRSELWSEDLESISDRLWWMSKQDSGNISPLHRQIVKGRKITITEDPRLHLVWIDDRIFIKPLPQYLASYVFWQEFMSNLPKEITASKLKEAALGYLRTYFYLIQYESDLRIAQDPVLCLLPKEVTWSQFCRFSAAFNDIADDQVSGRYHYGEIRLTRLNYYAPFLLGKTRYQRTKYQYRAYFAQIQGPVISVFAFLSILLNCMQVALAAITSEETDKHVVFRGCYWLSTIIGFVTSLVMLLLVSLFFFKVSREWNFALHNRLQWKKSSQKQNSEGRV